MSDLTNPTFYGLVISAILLGGVLGVQYSEAYTLYKVKQNYIGTIEETYFNPEIVNCMQSTGIGMNISGDFINAFPTCNCSIQDEMDRPNTGEGLEET